MKKLLVFGCCMALVGCSIFQTGSTFQTLAGKFLETTAVTVDAAMTSYAKAQVAGMTTTSQDAAVKGAYVQYQTYFLIATNAYALAVTSSDASVFNTPSNNLFNAKGNVVTVTTLGGAK